MNKALGMIGGLALMSIPLAQAAPVNVTVWDGIGVKYEDVETELRNVLNVWDLEMAVQDQSKLTLIGSWPFQAGHTSSYQSGDLFFNVGGDNDGSKAGWDYIVDVNWATLQYDIYKGPFNPASIQSVTVVAAADPWAFDGTSGTKVVSARTATIATLPQVAPGVYDYMGFQVVDNGAAGGALYPHQAVTFDLTGIPYAGLFGHFTMTCGNDDLDWDLVSDNGATLLLMGIGFVGLYGFTRRSKAA